MALNRRRPRRRRGPKKVEPPKRNFVPPETIQEFSAMSTRNQELYTAAGQIATEVRLGATLAQASRKFGMNPRTVLRFAAPAFRKQRNGRWAAKKYDWLLRVVVLPDPKGLIEVGVGDSRQASLIGRFWVAVERYRDTGDASALQEFRGKYITDVEGKHVALLTNLRELDQLASAGVLSFESLYARAA